METYEKTITSKANFHLAGIVPVAGGQTSLEFPFPDVMLPIANDYTLLDAAIVECAYAGCDTIWIVCNDDTAPLLRHRVGDYIEDPSYYYFNTSINKYDRKRIPIFWVPQHPKDRDKRDCLSWSVIYGALSSFMISSKISKWVIPDKYYVSFPYGLINPRDLIKNRKLISSKNNFYVMCDNQTVQDNIYSSFTFGKDEFVKYRRNIRKGTGRYTGTFENMQELPLEKRWSARFFQLKDVFTDLDIDNSSVMITHNYYNISSWDEYHAYMNSEYSKDIEKPPGDLFSYKEFHGVAT